jgi:hypothetical protein
LNKPAGQRDSQPAKPAGNCSKSRQTEHDLNVEIFVDRLQKSLDFNYTYALKRATRHQNGLLKKNQPTTALGSIFRVGNK